jgi:hypothetical protein
MKRTDPSKNQVDAQITLQCDCVGASLCIG